MQEYQAPPTKGYLPPPPLAEPPIQSYLPPPDLDLRAVESPQPLNGYFAPEGKSIEPQRYGLPAPLAISQLPLSPHNHQPQAISFFNNPHQPLPAAASLQNHHQQLAAAASTHPHQQLAASHVSSLPRLDNLIGPVSVDLLSFIQYTTTHLFGGVGIQST